MKKIINSTLILAVLIISLFFPIAIKAIGQISKPIIIENALRGQDYQEEIVIFNTEKNNIIVQLNANDGIQDWVTFYSLDDSQTPITETEIDGSSKIKLNAIIHISESAPNGEYKGLISAISKPKSNTTTTDSVAYLSQKIDRPVTITVSDNEIIKMDVSVIPNEYDLIKDEKLSVRIIYDNQGNIDIKPQIQLKIKKDENIISNLIYPFPEDSNPVRPNQRLEIDPIVLQTVGYMPGEYMAELSFLINNEPIINKHFAFSYDVYSSDERYSVAGYVGGNIFFNYIKENIFLINILIATVILIVSASIMTTRKEVNVRKNK